MALHNTITQAQYHRLSSRRPPMETKGDVVYVLCTVLYMLVACICLWFFIFGERQQGLFEYFMSSLWYHVSESVSWNQTSKNANVVGNNSNTHSSYLQSRSKVQISHVYLLRTRFSCWQLLITSLNMWLTINFIFFNFTTKFLTCRTHKPSINIDVTFITNILYLYILSDELKRNFSYELI